MTLTVRHRVSWIATTAIAVLAIIGIAATIGGNRLLPRSPTARALAGLLSASGAQRPTTARLSSQSVWSAPPSVTRGTPRANGDANLDAMIAAARIEQALGGDRSVSNLHAYATAQIVLGRPAAALAALEEAKQVTPDAPALWIDLAVACYESAHPDNAINLPRGLEAADTAIALRSHDAAAWFNKALILERLNVRAQAMAAWQRVIAIDSRSPWATEARTHLTALQSRAGAPANETQPLRDGLFDDVLTRWGEAVIAGDRAAADAALADAQRSVATLNALSDDRLAQDTVTAIVDLPPARRLEAARGHTTYGAARRRYRQDDFEGAAPLFASAAQAMETVRTPAAHMARLHSAIVRYRRQEHAAAIADLRAVRAAAGERPYPSIKGRTYWVEGLALEVSGIARQATTSYEEGVRHLRAAGEMGNAAFVEALLASQFDRLGDPTRAWQAWLDALQATAREGPLLTAAISATQLGWSRAALDLQHAAIDMARAAGRRPALADGLRWSATTSARLGLTDEARQALTEARAIVGDQQGAAWDRVRAEIDVTEAVSRTSPPAARIDAATRAAAFFERARATGRLPEILLARARARRTAGDIAGAETDLAHGIHIITDLREHVAPGVDQMLFGDVVRRVIGEYVDVEDTLGRARDAFETVDAARARDLPGSDAPVSLATLARTMSANARLVEFVVGDDRSFAWLVHQGGAEVMHIAAGRSAITRLAEAAGPPRFDRDALARLHALVFADITRALPPDGLLVVIPDGPLHLVAFAMLPGARAAYLVEEHPIVVAPSARSWRAASDRLDRNTTAATRALVAGNPKIDARRFGTLPLLPFAEEEARSVANLYRVSPLLGADVTREAVAGAVDREVVHFAGHAMVNETRPSASELVVWDPDGPGLRAAEIRTLDFTRTRLIVLAACQSAAGLMTRTEGAIGLARAFLAAGGPSIIASQWMADDRVSSALMVRFHQEYLATGNAPESLRRAQIALARSADESLRTPRNWAGFIAFGGAPSGMRPVRTE